MADLNSHVSAYVGIYFGKFRILGLFYFEDHKAEPKAAVLSLSSVYSGTTMDMWSIIV